MAAAGLDDAGGELVLEDAQVAGLVVADLLDAGVGGFGEAGVVEEAGIEALDALLVEGVDGPFGAEEVLEEQVVWVAGAVGDGEDGRGRVVAWEWGGFAAVVVVCWALSGYGAVGWIVDWVDGEAFGVRRVCLYEGNGECCCCEERVGGGQHVGKKSRRRWKKEEMFWSLSKSVV